MNKNIFLFLNKLNNIVYYWLSFTILTGIWETSFLVTYDSVVYDAKDLIKIKHMFGQIDMIFHILVLGNFLKFFILNTVLG